MLTLAMLCCGLVCLAAGLAGTAGAARDRRALALVLLQLAGGALFGWATGWLLGLTPAETTALALVGAAPGTIAANPLTALAGGDLTLAHAATAAGGFAGVAAVVVVCALAGAASPLTVLVPAALLPLWAGMALRDRVPPVVHRLAPILAGLALAVMIAAGLFLGTAGAALWPLAGGALVMAVALTILGHASGLGLGQGAPATTTAALALPMRNVAVPMLAGFAAGMPAAPLAAAIYGVVMYLPALALVFSRVAQARRG